MDCPACHTTLVVVERHGIEVDWCLECRGLWFDEGELELLGEQTGHMPNIAELGQKPGDEVEKGPRRCPRCRHKMDRLSIANEGAANVQIDRCSEHGYGNPGTRSLHRRRWHRGDRDRRPACQHLHL